MPTAPAAKKPGNGSTPVLAPKTAKPKPAKQPTDNPAPKPKTTKAPSRPVVHPDPSAAFMVGPPTLPDGTHNPNPGIDADAARHLLGWVELPADPAKDQEYHFTYDGKRVFLRNSTRNRPISMSWCTILAETLLRRRQKVNGESIIIGKTGEVASGQHRLVATIIAEDRRVGDEAAHWKKHWGGPVHWDTLLVTGIDEDDETVNTLDTGRPRTLADVIYRSEHFAKLKPKERKDCARAADWAVRNLWDRTHAGLDAWAPTRTHSESMAFLANHPRVLRCVRHVVEEDGQDRRISVFLKPGRAAALMYLMAACETDPARYTKDEASRTEKRLDMKNWDKSEEFWSLLASGEDFKPVRAALGRLGEEASQDELQAVVIKAWNDWAVGDKWTEKSLSLEYGETEEGVRYLAETPVIGGIDLGPSRENTRQDDPTEDEVTAAKAKIKAESAAGEDEQDADDQEDDDADVEVEMPDDE